MKRFLITLTVLSLAMPWPLLASAAVSRDAFNISILSVQSPSSLAAGTRADVTVQVKNIGSAPWTRTGSNFVSIYSYDPIRKQEIGSVLATAGWDADTRPARLPVESVKPGESATFKFPIAAPAKPGSYTSEFVIVAEGLVRMSNGRFSIKLNSTAKTASASAPVAITASAPAPVSATASATSDAYKGYAAEFASMSGSEWQISLDENIFIELAFKNTGTQSWKRDEGAFVSLYAVNGNQERTSSFKDLSWKGSRAASMIEKEVKPGEVGHFKVEMRAKTPGSYREEFMLSAENTAWMAGSRVFLPIKVPTTGAYIAMQVPDSDPNTIPAARASQNGNYSGQLLLRSANSISVSGNARQQLTVAFKNTGASIWGDRSLTVRGVTAATASISKYANVRDDSWKDSTTPASVNGQTKPGELGFLTFTIKAPAKKGQYQASFQLVADGQQVDGGIIDIPVTVTADGYIEPDPVPAKPVQTVSTPTPSNTNSTPVPTFNAQPLTGDDASLPNEPIIRVGLYQPTDNAMVVTAKYGGVTILNNGSSVCHLSQNQSVTINYDKDPKVYRLSGQCQAQSSTWYVASADDGISPIELSDYSHTVSWLPGANDNKFRSKLELRASLNNNELWVINELPIEYYLKGIGETSNSSPQQYQRALLTAARTYAMYHVQRQTKHAAQFYTVDATYDQVYRGYGAEARDPNVVSAVDATRGQIVTYQGKLAITPYYSRSDGRTRSWSEVWGGSVPWCTSVSVPWDNGKTLWGHGVGMSATGALQMDAKDGYTYDRILSYFYTGTVLMKFYK